MAHPIIEALYIGLLTSGLSQPVDAPNPVMSPPATPTAIQMPAKNRVVYDWAAGERLVFKNELANRRVSRQPTVGMTDEQIERLISVPAS